jgi:hypothetical protein
MPRPGFYNDNEYRAYPFVDRTVEAVPTAADLPAAGNTDVEYVARDTGARYRWTGASYEPADGRALLPTNVILDAGFIMGLDAQYNDLTHTIWLAEINKTGSLFEIVFRTNASPEALTFTRHDDTEWALEYSDAAQDFANPCADEPIWSGFLVTGPLAQFTAAFETAAVNGVWTFARNEYRIEPGRIQNLNKAYLRSISVGNYDRMRVPPCDVVGTNDNRPIILNAACLKGDIRFKEGYNCLITQTDRANEITVTAAKGAGAGEGDTELCVNSGEIPLNDAEQKPNDSKFYSGGPACNELISTINGIGGPNVNLIGGAGINVVVDNGAIKIQKKPNAQVNCT